MRLLGFFAVLLVTHAASAEPAEPTLPPAPPAPAQGAAPAAAPSPPSAPAAQSPEPAPAVAPPTAAPPEATVPETQPAVEPAPTRAVPAGAPAVAPALPVPVEGDRAPWYAPFRARGFADAYLSVNENFPKPQGDRNSFRAFDETNGFSLAWVGADVVYAQGVAGATASLRFGPAADAFAGPEADLGIAFVKQAFATWRPGGEDARVALDFGKFDTIYGDEVAESQDDIDYTRGILFAVAQPLSHTGFRASWQATESFALTGLLVNGWNTAVDLNVLKSVGIQLALTAPRGKAPWPPQKRADDRPSASLRLGYLVGPEQPDLGYQRCPTGTYNPLRGGCVAGSTEGSRQFPVDRGETNTKGIRHYVDLVGGWDPSREVWLSLHALYGNEGVRVSETSTAFERVSWFGAGLAGRWAPSESEWGASARAEVLRDPDGHVTDVADGTILTGTLGGDFAPSKNLLFRLEQRINLASSDVFPALLRSSRGYQPTTTLGVVVQVD